MSAGTVVSVYCNETVKSLQNESVEAESDDMAGEFTNIVIVMVLDDGQSGSFKRPDGVGDGDGDDVGDGDGERVMAVAMVVMTIVMAMAMVMVMIGKDNYETTVILPPYNADVSI